MKQTKQDWLSTCHVNERDRELLSLCYDVLEANTICDKSCPWGEKPVISPWKNADSGIWGWDSGFHAVTVSRWDTELAASCIDAYTEFQEENGLFPDAIMADGRIVTGFSKPPVLPWASEIVYKRAPDQELLKRLYDRFVKNESFWYRERRLGEFFYYYYNAESGWDDSVRWDSETALNGTTELWAIDHMCFLIMMYRSLAFMAGTLGDTERHPLWKTRMHWLTKAVETRFFDPTKGSYADVYAKDGTFSQVLSPASFMPLYIGIASQEHAEAMEKIARAKFFPGMPTVSYDDPKYMTGYWRGTTWLNVAYFAIKGLQRYGFDTLAEQMREYLLSMIYEERERGIFENYDSLQRKGMHNSYFSWSACFTIEFILGWSKEDEYGC